MKSYILSDKLVNIPPHNCPGSASGTPHIWTEPQYGGSGSAAPERDQRWTLRPAQVTVSISLSSLQQQL